MTSTVVSLRYATDDDEAFLEHLFGATRGDDFAGLSEPAANELLARQFRAQRQGHLAQFDSSGDHIIVEHDRPVGRLWVQNDDAGWELVDIAVLPERQRCGIATVLIDDLVTQADANSATVRLVVRIDNTAAQRVYFRHGFEVESTTATDLRMRRRPTSDRLERFDRVRQAVLADESLQVRLREVGPQELVGAIVDLAHDIGLELDEADVREARRTAKTDWLMRWV